MNLIDIICVLILLFCLLNGFYRGFFNSMLKLLSLFASWVTSFIFYPLVTKALLTFSPVSSVKFYIEGAERVGNFEVARTAVSSYTQEQLNTILSGSYLPKPYDSAVASNLTTKVFASEGIENVGDYYTQTIYCVIVNIVSFMIVFLVLYFLACFFINAVSFSSPLPKVKHFDRTLGAGVSAIGGFMLMYALYMIIPVILILVPVSFITDLIDNSAAAQIFYTRSIILRFIAGFF